MAYAVANAIFGGSAEYVALSQKTQGVKNTFYGYVTVMMGVAFLFSLRLPKQPAPAQAAGVFAPRPLTQPHRP